jgi:ATP-binding cassette subfamily F protein 3
MLLSANDLGLEFGSDKIFNNLTFRVNAGDRVALVGVNGAGKTSLIRILSGEIEPTSGRVTRSRNLRIGYLPQQISEFPGGSLLDAVCAGSGDGAEALSREEELHSILENRGTGAASVLKELASVQDLILSTEAYNLESRAQAVLSGLGFPEEDFALSLSSFSGGWKMRAMLASILLNNPDLILLDEPTNHLDLDARLWLEAFLRQFKGAAWIISHDPSFLDRVANKVVELEFGNMRVWGGNYTFYVKEKLVQAALLHKQARKIEDEREKLEKFVRKFRATESKRFQVRSREKMLEKLEAVASYKSPKRMAIQPPDVPRSGTKVLQMSNVSKVYDKTVFSDVNLEIQRGDRLGIVGRNGGGKSTLSRLFAGIEAPTTGRIAKGTGVAIGYYSQEIDLQLNTKHTVLQHVHSISPARSEREIRSYLGRYLFTGDDVMKPVSVLSGGELSRLALAGILIKPTNFLILDEPTNHLDIFSRDVLQEALRIYRGTLVLISHDEKLLSALAEKLLVVSNEKVTAFSGNFAEYVERLRSFANQQFNRPVTQQEDKKEAEKERKRKEADQRNLAYRERRKKEKRIERIEKKMEPHEKRRKEIEALFCQPDIINNSSVLVELQKEHAYLTDEISALEEQWMVIAGED